MTTTALDILIRARDQASRTINGVATSGKRLDSSMSGAGKSTSKLGGFFQSTAGKLTGLVGGAVLARGAFNFGKEAIANAQDAQRSLTAFDAALKRTGQAASINEDKFNDWLQTMGEQIGQDDEDLRDLATSLASAFNFDRLGGDATQNLMTMSRSIQDVAAATGKSSGLIKRTFLSLANDPAAAVVQFQKLGVISEKQADQFKELADKGDDVAVTQKILQLTAERYGGAAAANTTTAEKLRVTWENFKELLGNGLLPLYNAFTEALVVTVGWLRRIPGPVVAITGAMLGGVAVVFLAIKAFKKMKAAVTAVNLAMKANPWAIVVALVIAATILVIKNWDKVKRFFIAAWGIIKGAAMTAWNAIKGVIIGAWRAVKGVWDGVTGFFRNVGSGIADVFRGVADTIGGIFRGIWNGIAGAWNNTIGALSFRIPGWVPVIGGKGFDVPDIPTLDSGGLVKSTGLAIVHKGEVFSGVNRNFGPFSGRNLAVAVSIDRRRWVQQSEFEQQYRGF